MSFWEHKPNPITKANFVDISQAVWKRSLTWFRNVHISIGQGDCKNCFSTHSITNITCYPQQTFFYQQQYDYKRIRNIIILKLVFLKPIRKKILLVELIEGSKQEKI